MAGSQFSPSSVCHPPKKSLGLILKAALAEQDSVEMVGGREFIFSEDFCMLKKSGVYDKKNFSRRSVKISPIHSSSNKGVIVMDQKTEVAHAKHHFELSCEGSEESEIT